MDRFIGKIRVFQASLDPHDSWKDNRMDRFIGKIRVFQASLEPHDSLILMIHLDSDVGANPLQD